MSTSTLTVAPSAPASVRPVYRVTGRRVVRSEWAKFGSLRSGWITLGVAVLFLVGIGAVAALVYSPTVRWAARAPNRVRR